jgi:GNAT superfamily N-acetyltransferase
MTTTENKLDNPVWHSLSETHEKLALVYENIKFFHPDYCPFGGIIKNENVAVPILEYANMLDDFFIVGEKPEFAAPVKLKGSLECNQMHIHQKINLEIKEDIVKLEGKHSEELFRFVNLFYPGYFRRKTFLLGSYYGIFKGGKLVAVTGERMQTNEHIEVSAVVTHLEHTGKGYAKQLVAHTVENIFRQNKVPFLHVAWNNVSAIALYEKLGFTTRRKIMVWNLEK